MTSETSLAQDFAKAHRIFTAREFRYAAPQAHKIMLCGWSADPTAFRQDRAPGTGDQLVDTMVWQSCHLTEPWSEHPFRPQRFTLATRPLTAGQQAPYAWVLCASQLEPWTPVNVNNALRKSATQVGLLTDRSGLFAYGRVTEFTAENVLPVTQVVSERSRPTLVVIAHAPTPELTSRYRMLLSRLAAEYAGLLDFAVFSDPGSRERGRMRVTEGINPETGERFHSCIPPRGGLRAVVPHGVPASVLPSDLAFEMTGRSAGNSQSVRTWLDRLAWLPLHAEWPRRAFAQGIASFTAEWLEGVGVEQVVAALEAEFMELRRCYDGQEGKISELEKQLGVAQQDVLLNQGNAARLERMLKATTDSLHSERAARAAAEAALVAKSESSPDNKLGYAQQLDERDRVIAGLEKDVRERESALRKLRQGLRKGAQRSEPPPVPVNWSFLVKQAARAFPSLEITDAAVKPALGTLNVDRNSGRWLKNAWQALAVLNDFAESLKEGEDPLRSFAVYLQQHPTSDLPIGRFRAHEAKNQSKQMRAQRTFPSSLGPVYCGAHIDIGGVAPPAPRLHYYHDQKSGLIVVGYLGPHLESQRTN